MHFTCIYVVVVLCEIEDYVGVLLFHIFHHVVLCDYIW
jgi:hypothetical protein